MRKLFINQRKRISLSLLVVILIFTAAVVFIKRDTLLNMSADIVPGDTYYVSTDGKTTNSGATDSPWPSVEYALSQVGGGKTIILKPGIYHGPISIWQDSTGTEAHPTIIKSEQKWKATIIGAPGLDNSGIGIVVGAGSNYVIIDGFEVMGARVDGIKVSGNYGTVKNNWVHSNAQQGISMHAVTGGVIERNLVEFNGTHISYHHGVYADGDGLIIRSNIVRYNAGYGLHLYPSIKNSSITNNLVYDQTNNPGVLVACPTGGGKNVIANNTIAGNKVGLNIWDGDGEVVANNILYGNTTQVLLDSYGAHVSSNTVAPNNLIYSPSTPTFGTNTIYSDPLYNGGFWLTASSPAVDNGDPLYVPDTDFWDYAYPKEAKPYIGSFPYGALFKGTISADWYYGWGYGYPPGGNTLSGPDYWSWEYSKPIITITSPTEGTIVSDSSVTVSYTVDGEAKTKIFSDLTVGDNLLEITEGNKDRPSVTSTTSIKIVYTPTSTPAPTVTPPLNTTPTLSLSPSNFSTKWNMISFADLSAAITNKTLLPDTFKIRKYDGVSNSYVKGESEDFVLIPGAGYWLKVDDVNKINGLRYALNQTSTTEVAVTKGWNLLGNPFQSDLPLSNLVVKYKDGSTLSYADAIANKDVSGYAWSWEASSKEYLFIAINPDKYKTSATKKSVIAPFRGFWMIVNSDQVSNIILNK